MKASNVHQPPPERVVAELIKAGLSVSTALAMEAWKAQEVLDLLRAKNAADLASQLNVPEEPLQGRQAI